MATVGLRNPLLATAAQLFALVRLLAGCSTPGTSGSTTPPAPGSRAPWCPATIPQQGAACTPGPTLQGVSDTPCEYRVGSNPHCTTIARCNSGTWAVTPADASCTANAASCPTIFDAGNTDMCSTPQCTYAAGRCQCLTCTGTFMVCGGNCRTRDSGTEWQCLTWPQSDCPDPGALLGTACTDVDAGTECVGLSMHDLVCAGGYWTVPVINGGC